LRAAKAGFADVETVAGAAVSVMNASGVRDVGQVYDVLFATLREGNAEFADIASYLPRILPAAIAAGSSLEQVGGAFAYLTAQGQSADKASNLLENAFKALTDPDRIEDFGKIGVKIFDSAGKMRPLLGIVQDLDKSMDGLTDEQRVSKFASIGLDMEASSAFAAMAADTGKLERVLGSTAAAQGELDAAFKNSLSTQDKFMQVQNQIQFVMLKIGEAVLPMVSQALDWVIGAFEGADTTLKVFKPTLDLVGSALGMLGKALAWVYGGVSDLVMFLWKSVNTLVQAFNVFNAVRSGGNVAEAVQTLKDIWAKPAAAGGAPEPQPDASSSLMPPAPTAAKIPAAIPGKPVNTRNQPSAGGVTGAAQQGRSIVMNVKIGDNHFHVSAGRSEGSSSIEDFARMMREALIRELRNVESIA
jgi:TP901 family phage tail tape measure protein